MKLNDGKVTCQDCRWYKLDFLNFPVKSCFHPDKSDVVFSPIHGYFRIGASCYSANGNGDCRHFEQKISLVQRMLRFFRRYSK